MNIYNAARSTVDRLRDRYAPVSHTSTFRSTGQLTPEEFVTAGDFLVYKFPTWSWADASDPSKRVNYLPVGKQYLVTRGVPCHRRLADHIAAAAGAEGAEDSLIKDMLGGEGDDGEEGWLRTGGDGISGAAHDGSSGSGKVHTLDESGKIGADTEDDEDDIPDMEDEDDDDDAIIREAPAASPSDPKALAKRTYNLYITYTAFYRTPRLYLSGYLSTSEPLPPTQMMEDIVGDYKDKTVTLESFPFVDAGLKMASVHPCKHASVMKVLLDRADAALKLRVARIKEGKAKPDEKLEGMEGLEDALGNLKVGSEGATTSNAAGVASHAKDGGGGGGGGGEEWEVLEEAAPQEDEVAIRVDQYLVVFLKFMASVTPTIEHDFTTSA